jgi:hypothetical protein
MVQKHMRISDLFPSKYLRASDLQGHTVRVKITSVEKVSMRDPRTRQENFKAVVHFEGKQKGLVLNKTNASTLADSLGDETDEWIGREITLYPAQVSVGGTPKDCIKVRV